MLINQPLSQNQQRINIKCQQHRQIQSKVIKQLKATEEQITKQITELISSIHDPQRCQTLSELKIIDQNSVRIYYNFPIPHVLQHNISLSLLPIIRIELKPTVPHCHLIHLIGLAIRMKLMQQLPALWVRYIKIIIKCIEGSHYNQKQIYKQVNDKQRICAALENQEIYNFVKKLIT